MADTDFTMIILILAHVLIVGLYFCNVHLVFRIITIKANTRLFFTNCHVVRYDVLPHISSNHLIRMDVYTTSIKAIQSMTFAQFFYSICCFQKMFSCTSFCLKPSFDLRYKFGTFRLSLHFFWCNNSISSSKFDSFGLAVKHRLLCIILLHLSQMLSRYRPGQVHQLPFL